MLASKKIVGFIIVIGFATIVCAQETRHTGLTRECLFGAKEIEITLTDAINSSVNNNLALQLEKFNPEIRQAAVQEARAKFDGRISAYANMSDRAAETVFQQGNVGSTKRNQSEVGLELENTHPNGSVTSVELATSRNRTHQSPNQFATSLRATLRQPLKRGAGREVNLVSIKRAELDLLWSEHELRAFVLNLVAQSENRYWQSYLALEEVEIVKESLRLAHRQYQDTMRRIEAGSIPESEEAAVAAELAMRQEDLINAESRAMTTNVELLRVMNPHANNFWRLSPILTQKPETGVDQPGTLNEHIALALELRPEIAQARLQVERDELEVIQTRNGTLPRLDFFVTLGKTGYANSFGGSNPRTGLSGNYDASTGLIYDVTPRRRANRAQEQRAELNLALRNKALLNMKQLIKEDVIKAFVEVNRAYRQIEATRATMKHQREKLRMEEVRFSVGKTTSFQVAQAQRDLTAAMLSEAKAVTGYINSLVGLYRADGTLLDRRGIIVRPIQEEKSSVKKVGNYKIEPLN